MCALPGRRSWIPFLAWTSLGAVRVVCQLPLSLLGAARDVCQLLSDLAAAQWYCRFMHFWFHFGMVLASFWASGVTWRLPGEPLCPTSAPGSSQARFLAHFGQPWALLLEPFSETFSAQGPLQSPPAAIFYQFRPHVVTLRF